MADFHGVEREKLKSSSLLRGCLKRASFLCRLTMVRAPVVHRFAGGGLTAFVLLAESHISIHTYPEREFAAMDVFTCGKIDPRRVHRVFQEALRPKRERVTCSVRGALESRRKRKVAVKREGARAD